MYCYLDYFSPVGKILKVFFFVFKINNCLGITFFGFILFGIFSASWTYEFMFFAFVGP